MADGRKLAAVFAAIVVVGVVGTLVLSLAGGGAAPADGADISGQSPEQFQPENVNQDFDDESGDISIGGNTSDKRILVDTRHGNDFDRADLEHHSGAVFEAGHRLEFADASTSGSSRGVSRGTDDGSGFRNTLAQYDGVLIIQPTQGFSQNETEALQDYADAGGRVVILAEPTQISGGAGPFAAPAPVQFGANNMTAQFGFRVGSEMLYNMDDANNDNNFKSIYASPDSDGMLTEGVDTISLDLSGYAVVPNTQVADVVYRATDGTRTLDSRREDNYPVVARNDNVVFVADTSFIKPSELYDVDNEAFAGNLMQFLVTGDLASDFGPADGSQSGPRAPPEPPERPTPSQPPTPTPPGTPTPPDGTSE